VRGAAAAVVCAASTGQIIKNHTSTIKPVQLRPRSISTSNNKEYPKSKELPRVTDVAEAGCARPPGACGVAAKNLTLSRYCNKIADFTPGKNGRRCSKALIAGFNVRQSTRTCQHTIANQPCSTTGNQLIAGKSVPPISIGTAGSGYESEGRRQHHQINDRHSPTDSAFKRLRTLLKEAYDVKHPGIEKSIKSGFFFHKSVPTELQACI